MDKVKIMALSGFKWLLLRLLKYVLYKVSGQPLPTFPASFLKDVRSMPRYVLSIGGSSVMSDYRLLQEMCKIILYKLNACIMPDAGLY